MNWQPPDLPDIGTCPRCGTGITREQLLPVGCTECQPVPLDVRGVYEQADRVVKNEQFRVMRVGGIRGALLRMLGADKLMRSAYREGFHMARELDPGAWNGHEQASFFGYWGCWKSEAEAWANSDAEEKL